MYGIVFMLKKIPNRTSNDVTYIKHVFAKKDRCDSHRFCVQLKISYCYIGSKIFQIKK